MKMKNKREFSQPRGKCEFCKEEAELYPCLIDGGESVLICEGCVEELREGNQE